MDLETIEDAGPWREPSGYFPAMYVTVEGTSETGRRLELYTNLHLLQKTAAALHIMVKILVI